MPPNPRVDRAFRAMKALGISGEKVKPVLKNLLRLYNKNWDLIEAENYRALADAIFDNDEAKVLASVIDFCFSSFLPSIPYVSFMWGSFTRNGV